MAGAVAPRAYGQVRAAGKLYGTELRQFTETGLPVIDALADVMKIKPEDVRKAVEDGKVGFREVVAAFKRMTDPGGQFAGMTERQGASIAGQFAKLRDEVESVGRDVGFILVEEFGLKEGATGFAKFFAEVRGGLDNFRPMVRVLRDGGILLVKFLDIPTRLGRGFARMVGDAAGHAGLARIPDVLAAGVRISTRLLDVGFKIGDVFFKVAGGIAKSLVPVGHFAKQIDWLVGDMDRFAASIDLDEVKIAEGFFGVAELLAGFLGTAFDMAEHGYDVFDRNIIRPFRMIAAVVEDTTDRISTLTGVMAKFHAMAQADAAAWRTFDPVAVLADLRKGIGPGARAQALAGRFKVEDDKRAALPRMVAWDKADGIPQEARDRSYEMRFRGGLQDARRSTMPRIGADARARFGQAPDALIGGLFDAIGKGARIDAGGALLGGGFQALDDAARNVARSSVKLPDAIVEAIRPIDIEFKLANVAEVGTAEWTRAVSQALNPRQDAQRGLLGQVATNTGLAATQQQAFAAAIGSLVAILGGSPVNLQP